MVGFDHDRVTVFLDLDQTVVHAVEKGEVNGSIMKRSKEKFAHHTMEDEPKYTVFERPGLQPFLDFLFENFNVAVWTAASKDYALFVVDKCIRAGKPERRVQYTLVSYHGDVSRKVSKKSKSLAEISGTMGLHDCQRHNTLIVDDYDEVYYTQPNNCVIAPGFYIDDKKSEEDSFLPVLAGRLRGISSIDNETCKKINEGNPPKPRRD
jgi:TFIIF-interacting CTD phosphatase-like protein